jgi:2-polyprenyl-6-methoxyphenol hydroxylase-like FAD-dependent oxidoreductase
MADQVDVLVVGAGPTGLVLAAQLQRYGVSFRIIDRALDRAHESRALGVQPRTLEVLAGLGVTEQIVERGNRAVQLQLHAGRKVVRLKLFDIGADDTAYPYLLFLSQAETERILGDHLADHGVEIERGVELRELSQAGGGVSGRLRHQDGREEFVQAGYVVGCDGGHSTVRAQAGIAFEGMAYPQTFVLADVEATGVEPGAAHAFLAARGILLFFPLGSPATWRLVAMRPSTDPTPVERPVTLGEVQALVDAYTAMPVRLSDPVWMTNFRLHNRGATHYRSGRIFLAGDAAHIHSPAGAQGMNTGIQDAVNLGWKLALVTGGRAGPALLDTYEPERAPVGRRVLRFTDRAFTASTSTRPLVRFVRIQIVPRLLPLAVRPQRARALGFRTLSQLAVRYRRSRLSVDGTKAMRRGPKPGDRLPDAPVTERGKPGTLHNSTSGLGFHVLLCGPAANWPEAAAKTAARYAGLITVHHLSRDDVPGVLHDHTGAASRRLGLRDSTQAHYLVRPDGHIAYRGGGNDLTGLHAYLDRQL